ncbi:lipocalin family protein [Gordonia sp. ABSL1-1]|uniref:lipocalin family protein n=1 Tax=Gordonia sp. ABSL1-1 TaxID=3053923 RepID=UPI00257222EA|nr:lipocalin family protein [Gordonia sp. ABSL1-1]MDL9935967.1 lipocalin family protein [Gordonia sp. ABSL1-1]
MRFLPRFVAVTCLAMAAAAVPALGVPQANAAPPRAIAKLDVDRYVGQWHQLAAYPQPFNLACARDTTANYRKAADGSVVVRNSCTTWTGGRNVIVGRAVVNDPVSNAQLRVSFPGVPFGDQQRGPTNYIVTALGDDYSWSLVTDPNRTSGFVLSRTAVLSTAQWSAVRAAITRAGLAECLFLTSPTRGGLQVTAPLCAR